MTFTGAGDNFVEDLALARTTALQLTSVEQGGPGLRLSHRSPGAVVGIVGPPGVGKSSLISRLAERARSRGERVIVLAADPTSPISGGALLGDRIRFTQHASDPGVFVRSFASRGHPGGLAGAMPAAVETALALGWDRVFVEPVGGGQNDIDVAACADRVVLVLSPESGDDVQVLKAGILEIADVIAVNKADRPGAAALVGLLSAHLARRDSARIISLSASDEAGIGALDDLIRVAYVESESRKEAALLSAVLNDVVLEARTCLGEVALRSRVLALAAQGDRRGAVRTVVEALG